VNHTDNVTLLGRHPNDPAQKTIDMCECGDAPATVDCDERGWLCPECAAPNVIACGECGGPTTYDDTYGNLCYRCCRADNE